MEYGIIDFHIHPFMTDGQNICDHTPYCNMSVERTKEDMLAYGVEFFAGSVISVDKPVKSWGDVEALNDTALRLREIYKGMYVPGFHIHPHFVKESLAEIKRMHSHGLKLVGELVPYIHGWRDYANEAFSELLLCAEEYKMVLSIHSSEPEAMDVMVSRHPDLAIVAAHPGESETFDLHLNRMKLSRNYYLDLSGTGMHRHGLLRHGIDELGAERFIYGSDYPTCNPASILGGIVLDPLISEEEKKLVLRDNAARVLELK